MLSRFWNSKSRLQWLVMANQALGLFPFSLASSSQALKFSMPLFLWSLAGLVTQLAFTSTVNSTFIPKTSGNVGDAAVQISMFVLFTGAFVFQVAQLCKCSTLAAVLATLNLDDHLDRKRRMPWCMRLLECVFAIMISGMIFFTAIYAVTGPPFIFMMNVLVLMLTTKAVAFITLYNEFLGVLGGKLQKETSENVEKARFTSSPNSAGGVAKQRETLALFQGLERHLTETEVQRDEILDYVGAPMSILISTIIVYDIGILFFVLRDLMVGGSFNVLASTFLLFFNALAVYVCLSSQEFCKQLHSIAGVLKAFRHEVKYEPLKLQLHYLISLLKEYETIDIGGWYSLGNGTLVSIGSFVATYLVVLLQVGGTDTSSVATSA